MKNILFLFVVFFSFLGCKKMKQHQREIVVEEVEEEESVADERQEQQNEELQESRSIAVLIAENAEFTDFHFLLQKADFATNLLENHGPYTVFIPTNSSLENSEVDKLDDKEAAEFAEYYILKSSFAYEDLKAEIGENNREFYLENSLGSTLQFAKKEDGIYLKTIGGDFMKVEKYTEASNGYLYKIEVNN